ncbi:DUF4123 domain-containing protein [Halomonas koreensis]|uniref:DUF4123 domain-containing protein n=1 Tax=Halomonas koreensis TaxID=245385 RepID=A0ABU1G701_9GAMM|nr:DUF4123 domain-containing protein [Halomonas koreensis]MDR5868724.1 DUF4123 domain-containing protein [Halomonas koreensis]
MDVSSTLKKLTEERSDQESVFVLFDGALFPAMQKAYEYEGSPQICPVYYGTRHEEASEASPCLYAPGNESKVWSLSEAWRDNGIVFTSQATFSDVLKHLQSLISVTLPSGQMAYWRFYSPEWLSLVMEVFELNDLKAFSGPITQWGAYSGNEWVVYRGNAPAYAVQEKEDGWLSITDAYQACWKKIMNERFVQRVASEAHDRMSAPPEGASWESEISRLFEIAKNAGYKKTADLERFIWMFLKHPHALESTECREVIGDGSCPPVRRLDKVEAMLHGVQENGEP